jgi:transcriptional regulator with GAF, ATPase, and Fis domain
VQQDFREWHILAWTSEGLQVFEGFFNKKVMSFAAKGECDHALPMLGDFSVFLTALPQGRVHLLIEKAGVAQPLPGTLEVLLGQNFSGGGLHWMVVTKSHQKENANALAAPLHTAARSNTRDFEKFRKNMLLWLSNPMENALELRKALEHFLTNVLELSTAHNGLLVLSGPEGYDLVAFSGLKKEEAQGIWEKMPVTLHEEILRIQAKIILPEAFQQNAVSAGTLFMKEMRSFAGFPVLAEGRLVAIFYLGFRNLFAELSLDLQEALESAGTLLGIVLQRALLREQVSALRFRQKNSNSSTELSHNRVMVGNSQALLDVYKVLGRLAPFEVSTLILGETGTGKELAAHELHRLSKRSNKPFVPLNAAALPENLMEAELFGYKRGSFTGALSDHAGLVEKADGGTLFIDEIGELPLSMQSKLLRVLQEKAVVRLGETQPRKIDFRLVAATHRDLKKMVTEKTFRQDLYYRLAGAEIVLPPLRDRPQDILPLAHFFKERFASLHGLPNKEFSAESLAALEHHLWPGNIRELENIVSRAFVMAEGTVILRHDLGLVNSDSEISEVCYDLHGEAEESFQAARDAWAKGFLSEALRKHQSNRVKTAKALGIGERTLFRYIEQYQIREPK